MNLIEQLRACRIVPVCAVPSVDAGLRMCEALCAGGLPVAEITFRTPAAADTIRAAVARFPEMLVGAGTILTADDARRAKEAGASFAVAPGCNPTVLAAAHEVALPFCPGVASASDIERALELGITTLKFFPAEAIGGVPLLKALIAPYRHTGVQFCPTGGIHAGNMASYLALPEVMAIGGSWMVAGSLLDAGDWAQVQSLAATAVAAARAV